jgi:hypothetical protein
VQAQQGTANLVQREDVTRLMMGAAGGEPETAPAATEGALAAVGLTFKDDDEEVNFDD